MNMMDNWESNGRLIEDVEWMTKNKNDVTQRHQPKVHLWIWKKKKKQKKRTLMKRRTGTVKMGMTVRHCPSEEGEFREDLEEEDAATWQSEKIERVD